MSVTYHAVGRIDASRAEEFGRELKALSAGGESIQIDMSGLGYISSAGLRVLLKLRREQGELRVFDVSPEVYEILEMTGFT